MRRPPRASTWALAGALCGLLAGGVVFAPASWLAAAVASATQQRVLLADARGSVWSGSAVLVLSGGTSSDDLVRYAYRPDKIAESIGELHHTELVEEFTTPSTEVTSNSTVVMRPRSRRVARA